MSINELQKFTYVAKYAKWLKPTKKRETWDECVNTIRDMHKRKYPQIADEIDAVFEIVRKKRVLPSQRTLQFGGKPIEDHNLRAYNCSFSPCDRLRFFQETMYALLCGTGVGFSVQQHHINKLPEFVPINFDNVIEYDIPDTIEGWSDSIGVLLDSYFKHGHTVTFNFDLIRPKGSLLSSGTGRAPGPDPLKRSLSKINKILYQRSRVSKRLRPIDCYDIVMHIADAVLSGGIRRSSCIVLFDRNDTDMLKAKTGNWLYDNPQRQRSNNTVVLLRDETTEEEFYQLISSVKEFGEPGFVWVDNKEMGLNPCVTKDTIVAYENGLDMVENCLDKQTPKALVDGKLYDFESNGFFYTGNKKIIKLEFASGREIKVTPDHKILTKNGWKKAKDIKFKDSVIIHNHRDFNPDIDIESKDYALGYLLGSFLGDGNISKESAELKWWGDNMENYRHDAFELLERLDFTTAHTKEYSDSLCTTKTIIGNTKLYNYALDHGIIVDNKKQLNKHAICGSFSYLSGLVGAMFDTDGTVSVNFTKGSSVRLPSIHIEWLKNIQIVLNSFGIYSKIYPGRREAGYRMLPDGHGGYKEYYCQEQHELIISCDNIQRFQKYIKLRNIDKINKIADIVNNYKRMPNRTNFVDHVINKRVLKSEQVYDATISDIHAFDANGIYVHNCAEVGLFAYDSQGNSGFQMCNLTTINGKKCKNKEDFIAMCKAASFLGTLQAGYTSFPYLSEVSENITKKEALLGVSICGIMERPEILLDKKIQKEGALAVIAENKRVAKLIGINCAARTTVIKPDGTTSLFLGSSSGIHPHHAKRYIRRVKCNVLEAPYRFFKQFNLHATEKAKNSPNNTDDFILFPIEVPDGSKLKNDVPAIELLTCVRDTYKNWINYGKRKELCVQPWLSHNVSNTVTVKQHEWDEVAKFIYENRHYLCGVSLLSYFGDKDYSQAPFTTVLTPTEIVREYGDASIFASGIIEKGLEAFDNDLWLACDILQGLGNASCDDKQNNWIIKAQQFAQKYFANDIRTMTYCLKDVYNWKLYTDLTKNFVEVNYDDMIEEHDTTNHLENSACFGGACEI